ncbi:TIGR03862 family flavoprotein [Variovorax sp. HJSM1_2]|uniref:TIGR03862 family flavoprotein n=1 Tax=Variovorax sp. HJSM1_2 TaxID=3366263 RepID=UPI003BEAD66B
MNSDESRAVWPDKQSAVVIGAGPAGLMAAEVLAQAGKTVHVFDAMPSVGRKFLLAGKGGLNLTHSEPMAQFASRFGARQAQVQPWLDEMDAAQLRDWAQGLGVETFVGTSGRVFPVSMKSAPLLRAWLQRLRAAGVVFHMRHRWTGWDNAGQWTFAAPDGAQVSMQAGAVVLAFGGGSWARLGSDGAWVSLLQGRGVAVSALKPANCGFDVGVPEGVPDRPALGWSEHFATRFAGQPFKTVAISCIGADGSTFSRRGEFVATAAGIEGSLVYAASALLRDAIAAQGHALLQLDLLPGKTDAQVLAEVSHPRGSRSLSSHLKSRLGLDGIKLALLNERLSKQQMHDPAVLARSIKALPLHLLAARPIDEAISSAGGIPFEAMDAQLMLQALPGVFCAGEMIDWEAPTGGYLLTASMASGRVAGRGALQFLNQSAPS